MPFLRLWCNTQTTAAGERPAKRTEVLHPARHQRSNEVRNWAALNLLKSPDKPVKQRVAALTYSEFSVSEALWLQWHSFHSPLNLIHLQRSDKVWGSHCSKLEKEIKSIVWAPTSITTALVPNTLPQFICGFICSVSCYTDFMWGWCRMTPCSSCYWKVVAVIQSNI